MEMVTVPVIKTKKDYEEAVKQIEELWGADPKTQEGATLDVLMTIVDAYENEHFPNDAPDPIEAILFRMDQEGYERKDLESLLGKTRVSELLNKKRSLTLKMIRTLHDEWKIPADVLIQAVA